MLQTSTHQFTAINLMGDCLELIKKIEKSFPFQCKSFSEITKISKNSSIIKSISPLNNTQTEDLSLSNMGTFSSNDPETTSFIQIINQNHVSIVLFAPDYINSKAWVENVCQEHNISANLTIKAENSANYVKYFIGH